MIKHRHFVALLAALALVLAGCETTDQAARAAVSSLQEENTVVPLGKVDKTKSSEKSTVKVPSSSDKKDDGKIDEETGKTDDKTGKTDDKTGKTDEETGKTDEQTGKTDEETGKTDEQTGKTDEETGKTDEQTGKTDEQTGKTDEETGKTDEQTGKTDEETGKTDEETGKTDEQTGKTDEETTPGKSYLNTNKILMQRIEAAREKAIDAGAPTTVPTLFKATEKIYEAEKAIVDAGATEDLSPVLNDLLARYQGLENIAQAKELKDEIDENNFAPFRQATYDEGKQLYTTLTSPLSVINSGADYNKDAAQAEADFRLVLKTAYSSLAKDERTAAYNAKLQADSVKAYISRKDAYTHAVSMYRNGELRRSVDPKAANESYKSAKEEFLTLYDEISKARAQAQKEIDEAKKRVTESESTAVQADKEAPLGNQPVEGIEDENAKLLEDDDFSNAEKPAEIEAPTEEPAGGEE